MSIKSTVMVQKEDGWYVATSVDSGVASQGRTLEEAVENLKEALILYYEDNTPVHQPSPVYVTTVEVAI